MVALQDPNNRSNVPSLRKRRAPSSPTYEETNYLHPSKKQKLGHPSIPPPKFWDRLSEIPLTRNALRELNKRNVKETQDSQVSGRIQRHFRGRMRQHIRIHENHRYQPVDHILRQCSPTSLTRIKRSSTHGGPDLRDLRGYQIPTAANHRMSSSQSSLGRRKRGSAKKTNSKSPSKSSATQNTTTTRSTGPYDRAFQQHLIDHNILPDGYEYPNGQLPPEPENMSEILRTLAKPRESLSPSRFSNDDFRKFKRADTHASKERQVTTTVISIIEGDVGDSKCAAGDIPFTNLDHLTDGTLVPGNPDIYYGARPEQLDRRIRKQLSCHILPSTQEDLPIVPNFFVEVKGPDGSSAVAKRQLSYDLALGSRGLNSLLAFNNSTAPFDNRAYTLGCTYQDGHLKMYANHPIQPTAVKDGAGFVMTQLKSWSLSSDADAFRQGAAAYRNGRDWAKQQRDEAITQANERLGTRATETHQGDCVGLSSASDESAGETIATSQETILNHSLNIKPSHESETSADELSLDFRPPMKRIKYRSPRKRSQDA